MPALLDASVWIPLTAPDHVHYPRARQCRVTTLALLRHLTNARILGEAALNSGEAWNALETWLAIPRIVFLPEPVGVDELLSQWASQFELKGGAWTDAYLAAFALAGGCRFVTFDADFQHYSGLHVLHLRA